MRFARVVFAVAGVWGFVIVTPLYWMADTVGRQYPPPLTHTDFYYGFLAVTLAWQAAFLLIAADPVRHRPLMIAAILEKFVYVGTLALLYTHGQVHFGQAAVGLPDLLLGTLFVAAFVKTPSAQENSYRSTNQRLAPTGAARQPPPRAPFAPRCKRHQHVMLCAEPPDMERSLPPLVVVSRSCPSRVRRAVR